MAIANALKGLGLTEVDAVLFAERRTQSEARLDELARRLRKSPPLKAYPGLTIYAAGSYARGEASIHSDVDLFFIHNDIRVAVEEPRLRGIRVLSAVIREMEEGMEFPPPSNDGQFLNIIPLKSVLEHLGGAEDDYRNHFTARMLLILESQPVYGIPDYTASIEALIDSYFRDYEDHAENFRTTFLVNDIIRFWKTLCLNYEHRRNQKEETRKIKQKIKNFKLKFSRLMTCFATVALLSSYNTIQRDELIRISRLRPLDRVLLLYKRVPGVKEPLQKALSLYIWFLRTTASSTEQLEKYFSKKENRAEAFRHADDFGALVFDVARVSADSTGTLRYLVI